MKKISMEDMAALVAGLTEKAAVAMPPEIAMLLERAWDDEVVPAAQGALYDLTDNCITAGTTGRPICPLCSGAAVLLRCGENAELPQEVLSAVQRGFEEGTGAVGVVCENGGVQVFLREVKDGKARMTLRLTGCVPGEAVRVFGHDTAPEDVAAFVRECVRKTAPQLCPPLIIGIGLAEHEREAAALAEEALCRRKDRQSPDDALRALEKAALEEVNTLSIGPSGFGGRVTALAVSAEGSFAGARGFFCAVKISCYACRTASCRL